jgi:hypothetical protein
MLGHIRPSFFSKGSVCALRQVSNLLKPKIWLLYAIYAVGLAGFEPATP